MRGTATVPVGDAPAVDLCSREPGKGIGVRLDCSMFDPNEEKAQ
jgi:hypothetical protein